VKIGDDLGYFNIFWHGHKVPEIQGHHTSFDVEPLLFKKAAGQGKSDKTGMVSPD